MVSATLLRTRSGPLPSPIPAVEHDGSRSVTRRGPISQRMLHVGPKDRRFDPAVPSLRRVRSEENLSRTGALVVASSRRSPRKAVEEDEEPEAELTLFACCPILSLGVPATAIAAASTASEVTPEELEFSGGCGGSGVGRKVGRRGWGGGGEGGGDPRSGMGAYYKEMLKTDPENPLLLTNYGKFLQEVEGDVAGAEDCFGRAILSNPSDGDALSLYGNLMWEAHGDSERAEGYLERAVEASPEDCYVLGSYAHFLWDADDRDSKRSGNSASSNDAFMVEAY